MPPNAIQRAVQSLLGVSVYQRPPRVPIDLDDANVKEIRAAQGGMLQPVPTTRVRWFIHDLETAQLAADGGDMTLLGQLARSMRRDGTINGLLKTRTSGLVALPKMWTGNAEQIATLSATPDGRARSMFAEMCPNAELASFAADLIVCGVAVAELVPAVGRKHPIFVRLDPEYLLYRWTEGRWYYRSVAGLQPIDPGNGRWVLATAGRLAPWNFGDWPALGRAYIYKEHALLNRGNFANKLANPARVAYAPAGATEDQRVGMLARLIAWGINTCFEMPAGWDAKLLESNGRGWDVFKNEIDTSDAEIMITLAGQIVTTTGGSGFSNADIHAAIKHDLINQTAEALADAINTQVLPYWAFVNGAKSLDDVAQLAWDTKPPDDRERTAKADKATADAITSLKTACAAVDLVLDGPAMIKRAGIPVFADRKPEADATGIELAPTDVAKVIKVDEARRSQGLDGIGDERGELTITELAESDGDEEDESNANE